MPNLAWPDASPACAFSADCERPACSAGTVSRASMRAGGTTVASAAADATLIMETVVVVVGAEVVDDTAG